MRRAKPCLFLTITIATLIASTSAQGQVPGAPTVTAPANGETVNTQIVYVQWSGDAHARYQVRICTQNDPSLGIVSDTGQVDTGRFFTWTGTLSNGTFYVFVRLGNSSTWGAWSATGRTFIVNTAFVPPGADVVRLLGNTVAKNSGPFNGLGFTYMTALRRCKYDRPRFNSDLAFMASKEHKYMRALSMVGWYSVWAGKEIAPVSFTNNVGTFVPAWPDYWQQLRDMIDIAYDTYGIRTELTIFADAQLMPVKADRITHMQTILDNLPGREHKIMHLEVANEAWQNGFPGSEGVADLRESCTYLTDRTSLLVGISATPFTYPDPNATLIEMYAGSTADIATEHFDRYSNGPEGGWFPVRDPWRCELAAGVPPCSHNEPIGPGSSVAAEYDPIKLVMGAAHAWGVGLPLYVFHSDAGVFGDTTFESRAGVGDYIYIDNIMPPDVASWERNDGKVTASPFTNYSKSRSNKWWPEVQGSTDGCVRNTAMIKNGRFVTVPIGILSGGLQLEARRPMQFKVYNPLTGAIAYNLSKNTGEIFTLAAGPGAYIIVGSFTDVPIDPGAGGGPGTLNVKPAGTITVDGNSSDWALSGFVTKSRGGEGETGDIALVGFDGGTTVYRGAYSGVLPTNAADHTAKVYSRQNATYQYFLVRLDDNQIQTPNPVGSNSLNDCVEFYIDPSHDAGSTPMSNSTSDVQLVIDAANQKNVYSCTSGYAAQVLAGVTSAVATDGTGWWLEVRITKTALDPDLPNSGIFGLDLNFRDNDNNNDPTLTTVYTWSESYPDGFPSKIPDHWGDAVIEQTPFGGTAWAIPGLIQAEDFDIGGPAVAYSDSDVPNTGGQYRTTEQVDISTTADVGGGYAVTSIVSNEWLEYTVNVTTAGDYAIKLRVASGGTGGSVHLTLGGSNITSIKSFAGTGGWDTWTTIIVPGIFLTAGNNQILRLAVDTGGFNINHMDFVFGGSDVVAYDLGTSDVPDGMTHVVCCDGITTGATIGGHICRQNVNPANDFYMYFGVSDSYAFQGNKNSATITMDYFDSGSGGMTFQYDGSSSPYTVGSSITLTGTNTWQVATFNLTDAYFGNRQNGGADFRFFATPGITFYLDTVMVFATVITPPPGQATNPNPANAATNVATNATLSWTAGSGATSHDVRFGTVNPPPFIQNQAGTTYNPGTLGSSTTYYWRIDEVNSGGTTTGTVWSFTTAATAISNSTFPSNAEGWNVVVWTAGSSNGTMAWISSGGNPGGNMRAGGAGSTNNTDSCQREGGEINKLISTAGFSTLQVQYDARFETDQTIATCTGTCTANVLEGNCADKLAVYYSTAGTSGPWTLLETVEASTVTQNVWATRTLNLPVGANNQANFALRFRWQFNKTQDKGRLDNIKLIDLP